MDILALLYKFFIGPLELFFEVVYSVAYRALGDPALAIIFLSLAMNILVLPLYRRADIMQEEQRDLAIAMKPWTDHIKKTFKGDERFMMLQTYNRQNGYKQTDILKSSISLLLEIPFFIAAFHFLSNLKLLNGVPFGPIANLGAPDALLQLGGLSINLLPILMTVINLISAAIYLKGFPLSSKIQTYGIAAIFLVLLYNSPAGLVFYWTLNNIFSLAKNIFYKLRGTASTTTSKNKAAAKHWFSFPEATLADDKTFALGGLFAAILIGIFIPLTVIQASPAEFIDPTAYRSPLWFIAETFALALGTFVLWFGVFYRLASPKGKSVFGFILLCFILIGIVNFLAFGTTYGNLTPYLQYDYPPVIEPLQMVINAVVVLAAAALLFVAWKKQHTAARIVYLCLIVAFAVSAGISANTINGELGTIKKNIENTRQTDDPVIPLSKNGKNVVVIMLDRAIPQYLPYFVEEKPELKEMFSGFTVYTNAISYGTHTNVGAPALYGGSDYRPKQMNERNTIPLRVKHNEALKVMPTLFSEQGFETTFFDPSYANYAWIPDVSIFNDVPKVQARVTMNGYFYNNNYKTTEDKEHLHSEQARNLFCYGIFKVAPTVLQPALYQGGGYNSVDPVVQIWISPSRAIGSNPYFMESYSVLDSLPALTEVSSENVNRLFIMSNNTTHEPTILEEPSYEPMNSVDNTRYDAEHAQRKDEKGNALKFIDEEAYDLYYTPTFYEINMAALLKLGQWFDCLKEQGVYDNTRIIIASDHSWPYVFDKNLRFSVFNEDKGASYSYDVRAFTCLLMEKDFGATGFSFNDNFMTTADVPVMATDGLIDNPVNPYTGNDISFAYKNDPKQFVLDSEHWATSLNNGNVFLPGRWYSVHGDTSKAHNWKYIGYDHDAVKVMQE